MFRFPSYRRDLFNLVLIFTISGLFIFQRLFFLDEAFFYRDFYRYFFPARVHSLSLLSTQGLFAWDGYLDGGLPMLGDLSHYFVLYPGNVFFLFFDPITAFNILAFFHFIWMAVGAFLFFERFSNSNIGAWVFAISLSLTGMFIASLDRPSYFYSAAYFPWICFGWVKIALGTNLKLRWRAYLLLTFLSTAQFFAGEFQVFLLSHIVGSVFFVLAKDRVRILKPGDLKAAMNAVRDDSRDLLWVAGLFLGLSAIQWLPTMELGFASSRSLEISLERMGRNSLHPLQLLTLFFPFPFPIFPSDPGFKAHQVIFQNEGIGLFLSFHTGIIVALMAVFYFLQPKDRREKWILGVMFFYFLFLSLGRYFPGYFSIARHLIPFSGSFVFPAKYFLPCVFLLCFFAARFFSKFHFSDTKSRDLFTCAFFLMIGLCGFFVLPTLLKFYASHLSETAMRQIILHGRFQIGVSSFFIACFLVVLWVRKRSRFADNIILLLLAVELLFYAPFIIWTAPRSFFEQASLFSSQLKALPREQMKILPEYRIATLDFDAKNLPQNLMGTQALWTRRMDFAQALNHNVGIIHGHAYAEKYGPLRLASTFEFWTKLGLDGQSIFRLLATRFFIVPTASSHVFDSSVEKISEQNDFELFHDKQSRPPVWVSYWWEPLVEKDVRTLDDAVPITGDLAGFALPLKKPEVSWTEVTQIAHEKNGYSIEVEHNRAGFLIISENDFPGWRAHVNGEPRTIHRAYGTFKAIYLNPGKHTVQLVYKPLLPKIGLAISLMALIFLIYKTRKVFS